MFASSKEMVTLHACDWKAGVSEQWPAWMAWTKPLSGSDARKSLAAVLLMNNDYAPATLSFVFADVLARGEGEDGSEEVSSCTLFDVWGKKSLGKVSGKGFTSAPVPSRDSVFLTLSDCE